MNKFIILIILFLPFFNNGSNQNIIFRKSLNLKSIKFVCVGIGSVATKDGRFSAERVFREGSVVYYDTNEVTLKKIKNLFNNVLINKYSSRHKKIYTQFCIEMTYEDLTRDTICENGLIMRYDQELSLDKMYRIPPDYFNKNKDNIGYIYVINNKFYNCNVNLLYVAHQFVPNDSICGFCDFLRSDSLCQPKK